MSDKVAVTKNKLDLLANAVSSATGASIPLTIDQMRDEVGSIVRRSEEDITLENKEIAVPAGNYTEDVSISLRSKLQIKTVMPSGNTQEIEPDSGINYLINYNPITMSHYSTYPKYWHFSILWAETPIEGETYHVYFYWDRPGFATYTYDGDIVWNGYGTTFSAASSYGAYAASTMTLNETEAISSVTFLSDDNDTQTGVVLKITKELNYIGLSKVTVLPAYSYTWETLYNGTAFIVADNPNYVSIIPWDEPLNDGALWRITWRGTKYEYEAKPIGQTGVAYDDYYFGNPGVVGQQDDGSGATFFGYRRTATQFVLVTTDSAGDFSLKIEKYVLGGSSAVLITKNITTNGTYNASNDNADGYSSVVVNVSGNSTPNLQTKTNINPTTSSQTITADSGYDGLSSVQINAMPTGTTTSPTSISGSSASVSTGTNTLTLTKTISVTPRVTTAGYVSSGTAGNSSVSLTASVTTKAAATITPSTSNQTIASGTYLTGTQTIAGDANLVGSNIISGKSIFGVAGTVAFQTYYTGSSTPASSLGSNGDIYLKT